ncbi:MAG: NUDIX hydrolase [Nocardiopsaceae bacterium]|nr:NUDIX hydrolase [Nocardiopsaceae bacterium]
MNEESTVNVADTPESWPVEAATTNFTSWLLSVRTEHVRFPDNHSAERIVASHPGAVAVVALDGDDRVLMIRQYRHPVGRLLWEVPAGLRDVDGEPLLEVAQRELLEETSYAAREWHVLTDYFTSPGFSTERIRVFLARGLERVPDNGYQREGEEKFLEFGWVPLDEAVSLVLAGKLHNSATVTGILAAHAALMGSGMPLRPANSPEE